MRTIDMNEFNLVSGGSVYETEDAIIWNRMPGSSNSTPLQEQITVLLLQATTNKPVEEVW